LGEPEEDAGDDEQNPSNKSSKRLCPRTKSDDANEEDDDVDDNEGDLTDPMMMTTSRERRKMTFRKKATSARRNECHLAVFITSESARAATGRGAFLRYPLMTCSLYLQKVGRQPTRFIEASFGKIREAEKGRIPIGPIGQTTPAVPHSSEPRPARAPAESIAVIPLRVPHDLLSEVDAAWKRADVRSRADFLFRAMVLALRDIGADDVADRIREFRRM
jgi:hypothetical protein